MLIYIYIYIDSFLLLSNEARKSPPPPRIAFETPCVCETNSEGGSGCESLQIYISIVYYRNITKIKTKMDIIAV